VIQPLKGFVEENTGRLIANDMKAGQVTMFPQGLIHYQQNLDCRPVEYISGFNSEDPGVVTVSQRLFQLPFEAVASALGTSDFDTVNLRNGLPASPAEGRKECLKRCANSGVFLEEFQEIKPLPTDTWVKQLNSTVAITSKNTGILTILDTKSPVSTNTTKLPIGKF
jgi:hypothetical protein